MSGLCARGGKGGLMGVTPSFRKGSPPGRGVVASQEEAIRLQHTWELGKGLATRDSGKKMWAWGPLEIFLTSAPCLAPKVPRRATLQPRTGAVPHTRRGPCAPNPAKARDGPLSPGA